ncbi:glycosyltransferase family 39 protein [Microtetraspora sp. AC03309]|uniref:ArnT family glycosyltransferase n=1 Tax=Microtetraspora sp. AC03309 TaxID=2779376 RepID=UPI00272E640F|nr:glycosyltransferase family 39 protein [Microtetraspora sp. AC03309]MCC5581851.1 glycosyltransferase family 39 protein [Microtetraspora sp. AC03309]
MSTSPVTTSSAAPARPSAWRTARHDPRWARPAMWAVLVLAAVLYTWALGAGGYANEYYAAAVYSGTQSWKAFFFGALDAGSFITVDKPPFALWVMGLSARVFGFGTWSMLLPQAAAGVASVALVHSAVRRSLAGPAGHAAALVAALVMTLTPITVAINRDNNPDTVLVLLLVAAAWFCLEAIRTGRLRTIVIAAVLVGLAFTTKMLQAYLVLPAFALVYLYASAGAFSRRIGRLLVAGVALAVSSAWWMVIVDLWPADDRPYVGGSTDNTVWDLVVGYNGLGRIFGRSGGGGGGGQGASFGGAAGADRLFNDIMAGQISWLIPFAVAALVAGLVLTGRRAAALTGGAVLRGEGDRSATVTALRPDRRSATRAALLLWGGWLVVHYAVFSFSAGTFHPYYSTAMAPAIAALAGMGGVLMWRALRSSRAWAWVLPAAVAVTGGWSFTVLRRTTEFVPWLAWAVAGATAMAVLGLVAVGYGVRRVTVVALAAGLFAGLAGPAAYAVTPLGSAVNGTNPTAGPSTGRGMRGPGGFPGGFEGGPGGGFPGGFGDGPEGAPGGPSGARYGGPGEPGGTETPEGMPPGGTRPGGRAMGFPGGFGGGPGGGISDAMVAYLKKNQGDATWLVAVGSAQSASSVILSTGRPVIAMGGFTGSDPAMSVATLKRYVAEGKLKYVVVGGRGPGGGDSEVTEWVKANGTPVDSAEIGGAEAGGDEAGGAEENSSLYKLA